MYLTFSNFKGDDTSNDYNPLYRERHQVQLFGRGYIAGIDIKSQRNETGAFYSKLLDEKWSEDQSSRNKELQDMRKKKEEQKAFDERHWRKKPLEMMRDRDWRILREDFSIATKVVPFSSCSSLLFCLGWKYSKANAILERINHSRKHPQNHFRCRIQRSNSYPATSHSHRYAESRHYRCC